MDTPFVTAVIKARDEEQNIEDAIRSLAGFADEVIVVDDGSRDATVRLALSCGAVVMEARSRDGVINELDKIGFLAAKGEWLLRMDADERMQPELASELLRIAREGRANGVRFARKNMIFGGWARHGGWFKADQLRFFRADAWDRNWFFGDIHSQVPVDGPVATLPLRPELATIHHDYASVKQFVKRSLSGYAHNEALIRFRAGRRASIIRLLLCPPKRFLGRYIIRKGFLDGKRGLVLALLLGAYDLCIEANLWDIRRRAKTGASA